MNNWRDIIINKIKYCSESLIFFIDPDYILSDEFLLRKIEELEFAITRYENNIQFRFFYEKYCRYSNKKFLVYKNDETELPFDIKQQSAILQIDISTIYPNFSASLLRKLNIDDLDALYTVHAQYQGSSSTKETLDYLIKHYYKIPYDIVDNQEELYKVLLSIHYRKVLIPPVVKEFLYTKWKDKPAFSSLPLQSMITDTLFFYEYIETEWENVIKAFTLNKTNGISENGLKYFSHPFKNDDVRRLMNDLFLEGKLTKVKPSNQVSTLPDWLNYAVDLNSNELLAERTDYLTKKMTEKLKNIISYKDWFTIIDWLAELKSLVINGDNEKISTETQDLIKSINDKFQQWMLMNYHTLVSLAPFPKPKMVHHIPYILKEEMESKSEKVALLVIDGMSYVQWKTVKKYLEKHHLVFEEEGVFAWVPTLTSISRQAIFSGSIPITFGNSLATTSKEETEWKGFWANHGVVKQYVGYQKALGSERYDKQSILPIKRPSLKVYGAVVDVLDRLTHHTILGEKSLYSQLNIWLETNFLLELLDTLHQEGFNVYITSDHGNTSCIGIGKITEGVLVEQKGERVRIYDDLVLYEESCKKIDGIPWVGVGLPDHYHVLLAKYGESFTKKGEQIVTHGGISIEETIVPFIKVLPNQGAN